MSASRAISRFLIRDLSFIHTVDIWQSQVKAIMCTLQHARMRCAWQLGTVGSNLVNIYSTSLCELMTTHIIMFPVKYSYLMPTVK